MDVKGKVKFISLQSGVSERGPWYYLNCTDATGDLLRFRITGDIYQEMLPSIMGDEWELSLRIRSYQQNVIVNVVGVSNIVV